MHYNFYFDETFHDRKISVQKDGTINVLDKSKSDHYIGVFWGCEHSKASRAVKLLSRLEEKYKNILGLPESKEFKSTTIAKKNFKYGIKSFNSNTFAYYNDFFRTMKEIAPIIQIDSISKTEFFLRQAFKGTQFGHYGQVNENAFFYTLTKFILTYQTPELLACFHNVKTAKDIAKLKQQLLFNLEKIISAIEQIERKEREKRAFQELYQILEYASLDINIKEKYDFSYYPNFEGLCRLSQELSIPVNKINLVIDREEKTYQAACAFSFHRISQADSCNSLQLRFADQLSGFIGRMIFSLYADENIKEDEITDICQLEKIDLATKRVLSPVWFDITKPQFELYTLIYNVLVLKHQEYWTTMTTSYNDPLISFFSLIRYFAQYQSYEDYKKVKCEAHTENYNNLCCSELIFGYRQL